MGYEISSVIKDLPVGETVQGQLWRQTVSGISTDGELVASGTVADGLGDVNKNYQSFFLGGVDLTAGEIYVIAWRFSDESDVEWQAGSGPLSVASGRVVDEFFVSPRMRKSGSAVDTYPGASATVVWPDTAFKYEDATA